MAQMKFNSWIDSRPAALAKGPVALIFAEDDTELGSTIDHHVRLGFRHVVVFGDRRLPRPDPMPINVEFIEDDLTRPDRVFAIINQIIALSENQWIYYGYNAEYLFYPFCETRSVGEMLAFNTEERRDSVMSYVVDLYAENLYVHPDAVDRGSAHFDKTGYYALARQDAWNNDIDRQMDFFGGLRWRFEEHVPAKRRKIDRVSIFRAKPGLILNEDHTFNDPEYNTYACPWHNSITAAICSFRTAKALKRNPGSTFDIQNFRWHNSESFNWHSQQLMDHGLIEPGQWF